MKDFIFAAAAIAVGVITADIFLFVLKVVLLILLGVGPAGVVHSI